MNPYLNGIMALSQLTPEQFDMGMQRFQQIQGMQPQGLSALQARQAGLTAGIGEDLMGQAIPNQPTQVTQSALQASQKPDLDPFAGTPYAGTGGVRGISQPLTYNPYVAPTMTSVSGAEGSFGTGAMPYTQPYYQRSFNPYSGGFGMGQPMSGGGYGGKGGGSPYGGSYGRSNPYSSGDGMGFQRQPSTSPMGGGKGGGMPAYGGGYGGKGGRR